MEKSSHSLRAFAIIGSLFFLFQSQSLSAQQSDPSRNIAIAAVQAEPLATGQRTLSPPQVIPSLPVPRLIKFGGAVSDALGRPRAGVVGITFAIYADQYGGAPLWMETQNVSLDSQGNYSVLLGGTQSQGMPIELFGAGDPRWLGVTIGLPGEVEQPRVLMVSVPYALKASDADTLGGQPISSFVLRTAPSNGNSAHGTVTLVDSGPGLTGGPITTSGTISLDTSFTDARYLQPNGVGSGLTGVNAATLNGLASSAFARTNAPITLFSGAATFGGTVTAPLFNGSGAGLVSVNAATLGGFGPGAFAQVGTPANPVSPTLSGAFNVQGNLTITPLNGVNPEFTIMDANGDTFSVGGIAGIKTGDGEGGTLSASPGSPDSPGGALNITGSSSSPANGSGVSLSGGSGDRGGPADVIGGNGNNSAGGTVHIESGNSVNGSAGAVFISGGNSTNGRGGSVFIESGTGSGSRDGNINLSPAGQGVVNVNGDLQISAGGFISFSDGTTLRSGTTTGTIGSGGTGGGTVTGVAAGTGLTGGGASGNLTLGINTAVVPQLGASSNTFTGQVNAAGFTGSGAGLTGVNAATLGGMSAGNFASVNGGNTFNGNQDIQGSLELTDSHGNPTFAVDGTTGSITMSNGMSTATNNAPGGTAEASSCSGSGCTAASNQAFCTPGATCGTMIGTNSSCDSSGCTAGANNMVCATGATCNNSAAASDSATCTAGDTCSNLTGSQSHAVCATGATCSNMTGSESDCNSSSCEAASNQATCAVGATCGNMIATNSVCNGDSCEATHSQASGNGSTALDAENTCTGLSCGTTTAANMVCTDPTSTSCTPLVVNNDGNGNVIEAEHGSTVLLALNTTGDATISHSVTTPTLNTSKLCVGGTCTDTLTTGGSGLSSLAGGNGVVTSPSGCSSGGPCTVELDPNTLSVGPTKVTIVPPTSVSNLTASTVTANTLSGDCTLCINVQNSVNAQSALNSNDVGGVPLSGLIQAAPAAPQTISNALTITSGATGTPALNLQFPNLTSGPGVIIGNTATGTGIQFGNSSSGNALEVVSGGTSKFRVTPNGTVIPAALGDIHPTGGSSSSVGSFVTLNSDGSVSSATSGDIVFGISADYTGGGQLVLQQGLADMFVSNASQAHTGFDVVQDPNDPHNGLAVPHGTATTPVFGEITGLSSPLGPGFVIMEITNNFQALSHSAGGGSNFSLSVAPPLSSTGGSTPTISLGIVPIANGGTGSSTQTFVDLTSTQFISGAKTFSDEIVGSISGSAASFTGPLAGDITGSQAATTLSKIQGAPLSTVGVADGQVLRYNTGSWSPIAGSVNVNIGPGLSGGGPVPLGGSVTLANTGLLSLAGSNNISVGSGQNPTLSITGAIPIANGGTGISAGPTAAGQFLRSSGSGSWSTGTIQSSDLPSGLVSSVAVAAPLASTGGSTPTISLGTVPIANGGTGISAGPTAAGQFLRSSGSGSWSTGTIQSSDLPSGLVSSVAVAAPLASTGGSTPTISLGTVPIANGGTGISAGPTAAGQFLRSSGSGSWSTGTIQSSDLPSGLVSSVAVAAPLASTGGSTPTISLGTVPIANGGTGSSTQNFADLNSNQTIGGDKTFTGNLLIRSLDLIDPGNVNNITAAQAGIGSLTAGTLSSSGSVSLQATGTANSTQSFGSVPIILSGSSTFGGSTAQSPAYALETTTQGGNTTAPLNFGLYFTSNQGSTPLASTGVLFDQFGHLTTSGVKDATTGHTISLPASCTTGQGTTFNGSSWGCTTLSSGGTTVAASAPITAAISGGTTTIGLQQCSSGFVLISTGSAYACTGGAINIVPNLTLTGGGSVSLGSATTLAVNCANVVCDSNSSSSLSGTLSASKLNSVGSVTGASLQTNPTTLASLPTCGSATEGTMRAIIDSTTNSWGDTAAGGGTLHVLVYCDGTGYTVMAK